MKIAIVGATGMVGQTFIQILDEYNIPLTSLTLLASERSVGKILHFKNQNLTVEKLDEHSFDQGFDVALFSAGGAISKHYAPIAAKHGCIVIDNSSAWRMDPTVPLVVPEVNASSLRSPSRIIANPNCSTIQCVIPLNALKPWGLKRVVYSTYQAVSGSGYKGVHDLERNLQGLDSEFYPKQILHNVIPHIDVFLEDGSTKEEQKMVDETRKILDLPNLPVVATCVRVPVFTSHSVSVTVELEKNVDLEAVKNAFRKQAGLKLYEEGYPTPLESTGQDLAYVGRLRIDPSVKHGLVFWVVADNVRKGAASNAVQILQSLGL